MEHHARRLFTKTRLVHAAVMLAAACGGPPAREDRGGVVTSRPSRAVARFHMRMHGDELRDIERALLAGQLEEARARALALIPKTDAPDVAARRDLERKVAEAALDLADAPSLDEALRRAPRVATACAACHQAAERPVRWLAVPPLPSGFSTPPARMSRHVWATDRLWEGLIGPSDERWRLGASVLAETPLPFAPRTDAPVLAARVQELARAQLATGASSQGTDRAADYSQLLVACAACHEMLQVRAGPP